MRVSVCARAACVCVRAPVCVCVCVRVRGCALTGSQVCSELNVVELEMVALGPGSESDITSLKLVVTSLYTQFLNGAYSNCVIALVLIIHMLPSDPFSSLRWWACRQTAPAAQSGGGGEEDYVLYQALYAYTSDDADDLKFDANDIIQVTDEDEYVAGVYSPPPPPPPHPLTAVLR